MLLRVCHNRVTFRCHRANPLQKRQILGLGGSWRLVPLSLFAVILPISFFSHHVSISIFSTDRHYIFLILLQSYTSLLLIPLPPNSIGYRSDDVPYPQKLLKLTRPENLRAYP